MKFSQFVEGFLGLQGASNAWGGHGGGLVSNARGVVHNVATQPSDAAPAVVIAAESLGAALREAGRIGANRAARRVIARPLPPPAPAALKPAIMQAAEAPVAPPPPPPPGPAEPEVPPVEKVVGQVPHPPPEANSPPPAPAAAPAESYAASGEAYLDFLNRFRASIGARPYNVEPALMANVRHTNTLGVHDHSLEGPTEGQVVTASYNERCTKQILRAANLPAWGQLETAVRLFVCERADFDGTDCPRFLRAIGMDLTGITIHHDVLSNKAYSGIACSCTNDDDGGACIQNKKCTCDVTSA